MTKIGCQQFIGISVFLITKTMFCTAVWVR